MSTITKSVEVNVPVSTAYNQWTQFEEFPTFMEGVISVRQIDDDTLRWYANIGGVEREWKARITAQVPDECIAWQSTSGAKNFGLVSFRSLSPSRCAITLRLDIEPEGATETLGDWLGVVSARVQGDLDRFKAFIESRGHETGAWRGEI